MSREVRRVPLDWKHPTTFNPYWLAQSQTPYGRSKPASQLHSPEMRFVGLCDDYPDAVARWEKDLREMVAREGHSWKFAVEYHLTGYQGHEDTEPVVHPYYDGDSETAITVRDEDQLHELELARITAEKPDPDDYMPVWDVPEDELGWCLYETVTEGTPVTPIFATADELIDHLAAVGMDWDQQPMRRSAAEALVRQGGSFGTLVVVGGHLYDATRDADVLADAFGGESA